MDDDSEEESAESDGETKLFLQLKDLIKHHKKGSLLQELKSIITQATKPCKPTREVKINKGGETASKSSQSNTRWSDPTRRTNAWSKNQSSNQTWADVVTRNGHEKLPDNWTYIAWRPRQDDWLVADKTPVLIQTIQARFAQQFEEDTCVPQVVVVNELEDLEMTLEMVGGDPTCRSTVTYSSASDLPDEVARWHACGHRGRVPGHLQGKLQSRVVWTFRLHENCPQLATKMKEKLSIAAKEAKEDFVVRFNTDAYYSWDAWNRLTKNAGKEARQWCHALIPGAREACQDTWGFEEQNAKQIRGLMRVKGKDALQAILQSSGRSHEGVRWFTELKDKRLLPDQPGEVLWIEWQEDEDWPEYIARAVSETKHGLVRGRHQLGHRVHRSDARWKPATATWRLQKVPKDWEVANVEEAATHMGFLEVQVLRKGRQRMSSTWTCQAKRNDALEFVSSELAGTGDEESPWGIFAIKEARCRVFGTSRALRPERTVRYTSPQLLRERSTNDANENTEKPMEVVDAQEFEAKESEAEATKRKREQQEETRDRSRSPKKDNEKGQKDSPKTAPTGRNLHGGRTVPNPGKGDCLYHAFSQALSKIEGKTCTHRQLRAFLTATFRKKKNLYEQKWLHTDEKGKPTAMTFDEYIDLQGKAGSWAGALEADALATALRGFPFQWRRCLSSHRSPIRQWPLWECGGLPGMHDGRPTQKEQNWPKPLSFKRRSRIDGIFETLGFCIQCQAMWIFQREEVRYLLVATHGLCYPEAAAIVAPLTSKAGSKAIWTSRSPILGTGTSVPMLLQLILKHSFPPKDAITSIFGIDMSPGRVFTKSRRRMILLRSFQNLRYLFWDGNVDSAEGLSQNCQRNKNGGFVCLQKLTWPAVPKLLIMPPTGITNVHWMTSTKHGVKKTWLKNAHSMAWARKQQIEGLASMALIQKKSAHKLTRLDSDWEKRAMYVCERCTRHWRCLRELRISHNDRQSSQRCNQQLRCQMLACKKKRTFWGTLSKRWQHKLAIG